MRSKINSSIVFETALTFHFGFPKEMFRRRFPMSNFTLQAT